MAIKGANRAVLALPFAFFALPLALALPVAVAQAADAGAWRALWADPQRLPIPRPWGRPPALVLVLVPPAGGA